MAVFTLNVCIFKNETVKIKEKTQTLRVDGPLDKLQFLQIIGFRQYQLQTNESSFVSMLPNCIHGNLCVVGVRVLHLLEGRVPPRGSVRQVWSRDATELPRTLEKVSTPSYIRSPVFKYTLLHMIV